MIYWYVNMKINFYGDDKPSRQVFGNPIHPENRKACWVAYLHRIPMISTKEYMLRHLLIVLQTILT